MGNKENEKIQKILSLNEAYTHAGVFHADDILAAALLKIINPDIKIKRITDPEKYPDAFMFDIGNGEYDHHDGTKKRDDGMPYAAFGLLFRDLYPLFMQKENYLVFDNAFIKEIDYCDNTANNNPLSAAISLFNGNWDNEKNDQNEEFAKTVDLLYPYLKRTIEYFSHKTIVPKYYKPYYETIDSVLREIPNHFEKKFILSEYNGCVYDPDQLNKFIQRECSTYGKYRTNPLNIILCSGSKKDAKELLGKIIEKKIEKINLYPKAYDECRKQYTGGPILVLNRYVPYDNFSTEKNIKFTIFPSERGGYCIASIFMSSEEKERKGFNRKDRIYRILLPEKMRGREEKELREMEEGLNFVHKSGFMGVCDTKEEAIKFTEKLINKKIK